MHRFTLLTASAAAFLGGCGLDAPAYPTFNRMPNALKAPASLLTADFRLAL
jgi:hypothetical protein